MPEMTASRSKIVLAPGVWLWAGDTAVCAGLTPKALAATHASWAVDTAAVGPWNPQSGLWRAAVDASAPVLVCGDCASAMDAAWTLLDAGLLTEHAAVLAVGQSQGRGQLRRAWNSPPGNLYAAWVWPELPEHWAGLASLLAGYALCRALKERAPGLRIKWPNDLLLPEEAARGQPTKVGGILVEERRSRVLVGVGLNLASAPPRAELRQGAAVAASTLPERHGVGPLVTWLDLAPVAARLVRAELAADDPSVFVRRMEPLLAWRGQWVRVTDEVGRNAGNGFSAVLVGLASDGGLKIVRDGRESVLYSGGVLPL